jgi:hypothetical protein
MSIEEIFKRLIKMPIKNMIGYVSLMAMIALIGFSMIKAFNPAGDSNRASQEALKKSEEALKVGASTFGRLAQMVSKPLR